MATPVAVDVRDWGWRHGGRRAWAVRGVDLQIRPGERVLLLGASGSGKSTLLAGLAGLLDPADAGQAEGAITLDGQAAREARVRAGLVLQDPEAALVMARAGDDVAFGLENRGVPPEQIWSRVDAALAAVGFPGGRDADTARLSGGEQQRLAIAGIMAIRPGLLLLDEVTANLDPGGVALVRSVLAGVLEATGATAVLVEHRVETVIDLVDRAVVLEPGGGIIADGSPVEVFAEQGAELAARGVWIPGHHPGVRRKGARPPGPASLTADGVGFCYPAAPEPALLPTNLVLHEGEAVAVTGANGAGKSTLALILAGLLAPSTGRVSVSPALLLGASARTRSRPLAAWPARELARRIGTVFQNPEHQFVAGTVRDELTVGPRRTGASETAALATADRLLERLGLAALAAANPFTLSGGERRRLSVGAALASDPSVLIADEPTFGQDSLTWTALAELLAELRDDGRAVAFATHDEALVTAVADREFAL